MKVQLRAVAHGRSGDKGDVANIGLIAIRPLFYAALLREVTPHRVKAHFGAMVLGEVERFELPNVHALNFVLHQALDGGGTLSLRTDAQGKTYSAGLLRMEIELTPDEWRELNR